MHKGSEQQLASWIVMPQRIEGGHEGQQRKGKHLQNGGDQHRVIGSEASNNIRDEIIVGDGFIEGTELIRQLPGMGQVFKNCLGSFGEGKKLKAKMGDVGE